MVPSEMMDRGFTVLKTICCLGGVVVSVLVTGPKGCRFNPSQDGFLLMTTKICSTPSFRWEVKPQAHLARFYGM
jgi:hypothetical protein